MSEWVDLHPLAITHLQDNTHPHHMDTLDSTLPYTLGRVIPRWAPQHSSIFLRNHPCGNTLHHRHCRLFFRLHFPSSHNLDSAFEASLCKASASPVSLHMPAHDLGSVGLTDLEDDTTLWVASLPVVSIYRYVQTTWATWQWGLCAC